MMAKGEGGVRDISQAVALIAKALHKAADQDAQDARWELEEVSRVIGTLWRDDVEKESS
jgi:hypothetical protein